MIIVVGPIKPIFPRVSREASKVPEAVLPEPEESRYFLPQAVLANVSREAVKDDEGSEDEGFKTYFTHYLLSLIFIVPKKWWNTSRILLGLSLL